MKGISILAHKVNYDSGVMVSVRHLSNVLKSAGIPCETDYYENDMELRRKASLCHSPCLNIQGLSFSNETLYDVLNMHKNVVVSIHSTMCNLQVEEDALPRLLELGGKERGNLTFTCPSESETVGLNSFMQVRYRHLPNTFAYKTDPEEIRSGIINKKISDRPVRISLICAYRPLKNMITQVAAVIMLAEERPVELHMFDTGQKSVVYHNIMSMLENSKVRLFMHEQAGNAECFKKEGSFDLGLQVSLSETFSYVAFEHMIQGVPVIGSSSVPFASEVAMYSDVTDIKKKMEKILENDSIYRRYALEAQIKAQTVMERNNSTAVKTVNELIGG